MTDYSDMTWDDADPEPLPDEKKDQIAHETDEAEAGNEPDWAQDHPKLGW